MTSTLHDDLLTNTIRITSYITLSLCALGVVGNLLALRITVKKTFRPISSSVFVFWLAVVDTAVLVYVSLDDLAVRLPGLTADQVTNGAGVEWRCRASAFFYQMNRVASSWLVVALAVEMAITYERPERALSVRTRSRALYVSMTIILLSIAAAFPLLVITSSVDGRCSSKYVVFHRIYSYLVLSVVIDVAVPILLIAAMLVKSVYVYLDKDTIVDRRINNIMNQMDVFASSVAGGYTNSNGGLHGGGDPDVNHKRRPMKKTLSLGCVLGISLVMVITLTPNAYFEWSYVYAQVRSSAYVDGNAPTTGSSLWRALAAVARCALTANYALKFYILSLLSSRVRSATISLSTCGLLKKQGRAGEERAADIWVTDQYDSRGKATTYAMTTERAANYDSGLIRR